MRCAVSFLALIVISIAVGVMALLIIWFTESEDFCLEERSFRCFDNGRCLEPEHSCNKHNDCNDGSDEAPAYCSDFETMNPVMDIIFGGDNDIKENITVSSKPEICEFMILYNLPKGIKCHGRNMNETWDSIPWNEFDPGAKTITVENGAINTRKLVKISDDTHQDFPHLRRLYIHHNYIESLHDNVFCHMTQNKIKWLIMNNNSIASLTSDAFACLTTLRWLKLSSNKIHLNGFEFKDLPILEMIELDRNEIIQITNKTFSGIQNLKIIHLAHNRIKSIDEDAFLQNLELINLDLSHNLLHTISLSLLSHNSKLSEFSITNNTGLNLPYFLFRNLTNLKSLNISSFHLSQFSVNSFTDFTPKLDVVYFKKFSYCRFTPHVRRCFPYSDGLSSNSNLLIGQSRVAVWLIGLVTILWNVFVLANRLRRRAEITEILHIFVSNLAVADLLMGVYLLTLAIKDVQFRGTYSFNAYNWTTSIPCSTIGILALLSSEVSLFILTIMSLERCLTIATSSQNLNLNASLARASMLIIWIFAGIVAISPAIQWQGGNSPFYGTTGLCFPIHLDDRYPVGWQYTTFLFIGLNSCCLVLITISYSMLYYTVWNTQRKTPLLVKEIELASSLFFMVITNVLCWAPIILLKAAVLGGYELSNETVSCAVIYMLPLNSALNPILYTFSTKEKGEAIQKHMADLLENLELSRIVPDNDDNIN